MLVHRCRRVGDGEGPLLLRGDAEVDQLPGLQLGALRVWRLPVCLGQHLVIVPHLWHVDGKLGILPQVQEEPRGDRALVLQLEGAHGAGPQVDRPEVDLVLPHLHLGQHNLRLDPRPQRLGSADLDEELVLDPHAPVAAHRDGDVRIAPRGHQPLLRRHCQPGHAGADVLGVDEEGCAGSSRAGDRQGPAGDFPS
eukprot:765470-Hanusia_phi.AAC.4